MIDISLIFMKVLRYALGVDFLLPKLFFSIFDDAESADL